MRSKFALLGAAALLCASVMAQQETPPAARPAPNQPSGPQMRVTELVLGRRLHGTFR